MTTTAIDPVFEEVKQLDASGDHDGAVNALAVATSKGNNLAKTRLGKRLLVGDHAPYLPQEGAQFILEAANARCAEAVAMVAVMQSIGVFQQKNWDQALSTLAWSAALGWSLGREQMILLAGKGEPAEDPGLLNNPDPEYWQSLVDEIDLESWFSPPPGEVVHEDPLIRSFPELIPPEVCRLLVRLCSTRLKPALVYDPISKANQRSQTRTNSIAEFNLVENEFIHFMLQEIMSRACGIPMVQMEGTAMLNYQPGETISNHYDFVDPKLSNYKQEIAENGQRIVTFLIYLNEDYEGGETVFPRLDISHKGSTGEGLYFVNALPNGEADTRTLHAGSETTSGEKWIVSQFIRNREVKYILS